MIREKIFASNGWIPFSHYMDLALYAPGMGYYSSGATKLGSAGDFVTAPEISSLFGRSLTCQVMQILQRVAHKNILEFGAGSGKLACDMLLALEKSEGLPEQYYILEVSAELRQRQQALFTKTIPHLMDRIVWLERLPEQFVGVILANEVLDAMPVHVLAWKGHVVFERGVIWQDDRFAWQDRPIQDAGLRAIADELLGEFNPHHDQGLEYISEVNLAAIGFMHSLGELLQQGVILLIDYGFGRSEYYHPQRSQGTLMCHYRHHAHDDPFYLPGLQDITSHVDFSAITQAAEHAKLQLLGYTTQAHFLINCGIADGLVFNSTSRASSMCSTSA